MIYFTPEELQKMKEFDRSINSKDKKTKLPFFKRQRLRREWQRVYEAEKRKKKKESERVFRYKDYVRAR